MGLKSFFKNAMKRKVQLDILAGGQSLTAKQLPTAIRVAVMQATETRGEVLVYLPFCEKLTYRLDGIEWEESARRSGGKAAAGAIVGSVVAGPVGTLAGAAIGGRRRDNSKAYVYLINVETNEEIELHIRCDAKGYSEIASFM